MRTAPHYKKESKMNKHVLILGYGIDEKRTEAVSINTLKLKQTLERLGCIVTVFNIGYSNPYCNTGDTFAQALCRLPFTIFYLYTYISRYKVTHVHDAFVLPLASLIFTVPLKLLLPKLLFVKELHNDAGQSQQWHLETFIRLVTNQGWMIKIVIHIFTVFSRNKYVSMKYHLPYLPVPVTIRPFNWIPQKKFTISYLGHPLKKKGIYIFPKIFEKIPKKYKNSFHFSFALSTVGDRESVKKSLQESAERNGISIVFHDSVSPHAFFSESDIYLLPLHDKYSAISTPNTVLEAMEAGAVVIVTDIPSLWGIAKNNHNAILIDNLSPEKILNKILHLYLHPSLIKKMRKDARTMIEREYDENRQILYIKGLYE